jgi:hypothetical protein
VRDFYFRLPFWTFLILCGKHGEERIHIMHSIFWSVKALNSPYIVRRCSRCDSDRFLSSEKFRVNANGSRLDAWLIYKCARCGATLNIEVISRADVKKIDPALYLGLMENDRELALAVGQDRALICGNGVQLDYESVRFEYEGELPSRGERTHITLTPKIPLYVPVCRLIAERLGISQSALRRMTGRNEISCGADLRQKLTRPVEFELEEGWGGENRLE